MSRDPCKDCTYLLSCVYVLSCQFPRDGGIDLSGGSYVNHEVQNVIGYLPFILKLILKLLHMQWIFKSIDISLLFIAVSKINNHQVTFLKPAFIVKCVSCSSKQIAVYPLSLFMLWCSEHHKVQRTLHQVTLDADVRFCWLPQEDRAGGKKRRLWRPWLS